MRFLETSLEKLARLLSRQYNINVVFEGEQAKTDGQTIFLPYFSELTPELYEDLNAFLDHETAHIKFTDFEQTKEVKKEFHFRLLNGVEDVRIERLMGEEYPGAAENLEKLNIKLGNKIRKRWKEYPWPARFIFSVMWTMEGRELVKDPEIETHLTTCQEEISQLNSCKTTKELRLLTKKIFDKLVKDREEEKQDAEEGKGKPQKGEGQPSNKGEKSKDKNSEKTTEEKRELSPKEKAEAQKLSKDKEKGDNLLTEEKPADKDREKGEETGFDELEMDVHDLVNDQIEEAIKAENLKFNYKYNNRRDLESFASTSKYDVIEDYSGKDKGYSSLRTKVRPVIVPLRAGLEKIFKVIENSRWKTEREMGLINARALSRLASNPNYLGVFKEQVKNIVDKVAIEILIDLSGSMCGTKIETAKLSAIAMSEALKSLGFEFEVTGFSTAYGYHGRLESGGRWNRTEPLFLAIFKSFSSTRLEGLSQIESHNNNHDGESVWWAAKRLAARKEKRKILIVFSDGQPAGSGNCGILQSDLRIKLAKIEKFGIETVGIGIQTDAVKHFYKDYVIVNNLKDLTSTALNTLSRILLKGQRY